MGYTTEFEGVLKFKHEISVPQVAKLNEFFGEDPNDHPEWKRREGDKYSYLQYELTKDMTGIKWDGNEKFYYAVEAINLIIDNMKAEFPEFELQGELLAQGEELGDVWKLEIVDGQATRKDIVMAGEIYECPHCDEQFRLSDAKLIK